MKYTQVKNIAKEVIAKNKQAIRLDVYEKNPYALRLYEKGGFTQVGEANWRKGKFYLMEKYL